MSNRKLCPISNHRPSANIIRQLHYQAAELPEVKAGLDLIKNFKSQLLAMKALPAAALNEMKSDLVLNFSRYVPNDNVMNEDRLN